MRLVNNPGKVPIGPVLQRIRDEAFVKMLSKSKPI